MGLFLLAVSSPVLAAGRVVVVKSDALGPYSSVVAGFTAECKSPLVELDLRDDPDRADPIFEEINAGKPSLVFAIGPLAANAAKKRVADAPVVFAMVPNYEKYGLSGANVAGVALSRSVRSQLEALKALLPQAKRVGVLFNPKFSRGVVDGATAAAKELSLSLVAAKVDSADDIAGTLSALSGKIDVLWMIADRTVATTEGVRSIVRNALESKVPVLALSESQVKEGALLSLSPNYLAIGQQAGRLANRILFEKVNPGALAVAPPEGLDVALNLSTARAMGAECAVASAALRFAAKQGYGVRTFE